VSKSLDPNDPRFVITKNVTRSKRGTRDRESDAKLESPNGEKDGES